MQETSQKGAAVSLFPTATLIVQLEKVQKTASSTFFFFLLLVSPSFKFELCFVTHSDLLRLSKMFSCTQGILFLRRLKQMNADRWESGYF